MEYCKLGDLEKEIMDRRKSKKYFKESEIWHMWMFIVLAIHELNRNKKNKICHRGITPDNILIDENFVLKLGDFGHSKIVNHDNSFAMTNINASKYMAPE